MNRTMRWLSSKELAFLGFIGLLTIAIYLPALSGSFVYDDHLYIGKNEIVQKGLTLENIYWAFSTTDGYSWHPITWLSHLMDVQLFGLNPFYHHITSLILHLLNTIVLFLWLKRITQTQWIILGCTCLHAIHPMHVESVAWIAERKDVLSTLFAFLTLYLYALYVERKTILKMLLVICFFLLGLASKPMVITLPVLMIFLDYYPHQRFSLKVDQRLLLCVLEKIPLFIISLFSAWITILAQSKEGAVNTTEAVDMLSRVNNAIYAYVQYFKKLFFPTDLIITYPFQNHLSVTVVTGCSLFLIIISLLALYFIKRKPWLIFGWAWFLITLLPVIGIIKVGSQGMADRYTYLPYIGLYIMLGSLIQNGLKFKPRLKSILIPATLLYIVCLSLITHSQARHWKNAETLFGHAVSVSPDNFIAHFHLGNHYFEEGQLDQATQHLAKAFELNVCGTATLVYTLGKAYEIQERFRDAFYTYQAAINCNPNNDVLYYHSARLYAVVGDYVNAALWLDKARQRGFKAEYLISTLPDWQGFHKNQSNQK